MYGVIRKSFPGKPRHGCEHIAASSGDLKNVDITKLLVCVCLFVCVCLGSTCGPVFAGFLCTSHIMKNTDLSQNFDGFGFLKKMM